MAVVGAEVEHDVRLADGGDGVGDERRLGVEVAVGVVATLAVAPTRSSRCCFHDSRSTAFCEVAQLGVDQRRPEAGPLELGADVALAVGVGVLALGAGVQPDVGEHALAEAAATADDRGGDAGGDPVEAAAQQRLERHVAQRLDVQRVEEQLAELAVAGPRLAAAQLARTSRRR